MNFNGDKSTTIIRDTIVADTGTYYSPVKLDSDARYNLITQLMPAAFSLYNLCPSAQTESPIIDVNAAGESVVLVPGNNEFEITAGFQAVIGVGQNLYIGSSVM